MKTKLKLRIIWDSTITKIILIVVIIALLLTAIILPSVLTSRPDGSILAFNRDAVSGTREAFVEKVIHEDKKKWSPGANVREVRNNDSMITFVQREENSVGYVSFGTVAEFDGEGNAHMRTDRNGMDHVSFTTFEGIAPTYDAISSGEYSAARNFNAFFRVKQDSDEYQITNYDWNTNTIDETSLDRINGVNNANDLKGAYLFFSWFTKSTEAEKIVNDNGEIPFSPVEQNGGTRVDFFGTDDTSWDDSVIQHYIDATGLNTNDQILIEIVGSTSATALMTDLTNEFDDVISTHYGLDESDLKFVIATNGSGDAVSTSAPAGTDHPFIGMQSKDQDVDGLTPWGSDYAVEVDNGDGTFTTTYNTNVYASFAKDAILVIYNNENVNLIKDETTDEDKLLNVNIKEIHDLYTYNDYVYADEFFSNYEEVVENA